MKMEWPGITFREKMHAMDQIDSRKFVDVLRKHIEELKVNIERSKREVEHSSGKEDLKILALEINHFETEIRHLEAVIRLGGISSAEITVTVPLAKRLP